MQLTDRIKAPTPPFFKKLRTAGLILVAISTAIITAPVSLPAIVTTIAGYAAVAGSVIGGISQLTTADSTAAAGLVDNPSKGG